MSGLLKVPFFHDEILPSFLSRTAFANGRNRLRPFCRDLGLDFEALMLGEMEATRHAERVLGCAAGVLCNRRTVVLRRDVVEFAGGRFVSGVMEITPSRFCPRCFVLDDADEGRKPGVRRYHRIAWMLGAVPVCTRHSCRLVDLPARERPGDAFQALRMIDGSGLPGMNQRIEPTEFELFVTDKLTTMEASGTDRPDFSLSECIELCLPLGLAATYGPAYNMRSKGCDETRAMRQAGFEVFKRGESGFTELLDGLVSRTRSDRALRKYGLFGDIRDFLDSRCNAFHIFRRQMHAHAIFCDPMAFPIRHNGPCVGEGMSASAIAAASGSDIGSVFSYLRSHALISEDTTGDAVFVEPDIGEASVAALSQSITEPEASGLLGCSATDLRSLVISGLVTPLMWGGFSAEQRQNDRYHRSHLKAFRLRLEQSAAAGGDGLSTVATAVRQLGCEIGDVLKCVLDGRINAFSPEGVRTPLSGLRVDVWEAVEALGLVGMVGARDARRRLGLDQASFKIAAGNGLIAAELDDLGNPVNLHLTDIRRFERRYVALPPMARVLGVREFYLAGIFSSYGIRPAFPALGFKTHVFHRREVAGRLAAKRKEQECGLCGIGPLTRVVAVRSRRAHRRFPGRRLSGSSNGWTRGAAHMS